MIVLSDRHWARNPALVKENCDADGLCLGEVSFEEVLSAEISRAEGRFEAPFRPNWFIKAYSSSFTTM